MLLADLVRAGNSFGNEVPASVSSGKTGMDPREGTHPGREY